MTSTGFIVAILVLAMLVVPGVNADLSDTFAKIKYTVKQFIKDPKLFVQYIKNEYINPALKKDPYHQYQKIRYNTDIPEPNYMKEVKQKLNGYFSKLNGLKLENLTDFEVRDVTFTVMDDSRTYYLKHVYINGNTVKVDGVPTKNMVSLTPSASKELVLMLDSYLQDGYLDGNELQQIANWGLQKYKSGDLKGKKKDIEAILNFLLEVGE